MKNICVFGASCSDIEQIYFDAATEAGALIAERGAGIVFGGGRTGLMGAACTGAKQCGGRVTGVIPEKLNVKGIANEDADEMIVTSTMHERKAKMESLSDGYLVLAGGFGTLEEALEVLTLNQLGYISAPVVFLNTCGYFDPLIEQLERCVERNFTFKAYSQLYKVAHTPCEAVDALFSYTPIELPNKIKETLRHYGEEDQ